jgi:hypothetical protein
MSKSGSVASPSDAKNAVDDDNDTSVVPLVCMHADAGSAEGVAVFDFDDDAAAAAADQVLAGHLDPSQCLPAAAVANGLTHTTVKWTAPRDGRFSFDTFDTDDGSATLGSSTYVTVFRDACGSGIVDVDGDVDSDVDADVRLATSAWSLMVQVRWQTCKN